MKNKKKNTIIMIQIGVALVILGLILDAFIDAGEYISRMFTLMFSLGFGLMGGGLGALYQNKRIDKIPGKAKQMEIEYNDERNELIRIKANAKAGDVSNWIVILIAYICIIMGYPTWLVFLILGAFMSKYIIWIYLMNKYNKEI